MANKRDMMDPAFCWDLTDVFKTVEDWERALKEAEAGIPEVEKLQGTLKTSAESMKKALDMIFALQEKIERVYLYSMLYSSQDNGDAKAQEMDAKATRLFVMLSSAMAFVEPEILSVDAETLDVWMRQEELAAYRHMLSNMCRTSEHTLSSSEEMMLALLGDAAQTPKTAFEMFESVDMRFDCLKNEKPLTHALFGAYRESADPALREEAFTKYFGEYKKYINTIAALYSGSVKLDCYFAKVRKYPSALEAALSSNNVGKELYDNLIESVHSAVPAMEKYLQTRKRILNTETLKLTDLYVPLVENASVDTPFETAKQLVLNATAPLGSEYRAVLEHAFAERWIDVYENAGKTTGAYSCGVHGVHPYVLLNYTNRYDDAFTLAHEVGHSMHSWFSSKTQDYANHDYTIFVAEVASTVNEVLLTKYLLSVEKDPAMRKYILNHLLEGFRTTVFRQTLFAEFEMKVHAMYEEGTPLTPQSLNRVYHDLNCLYYPSAEGSEYTDVEWASIPHFYNAFYVYQYATGFCSAVSIADRILNHNGTEDYLRFLSTGGSMYPIDELKIAGVDLTTVEPIERALKVFEETVDEFDALTR